jgi:hypothetical protein
MQGNGENRIAAVPVQIVKRALGEKTGQSAARGQVAAVLEAVDRVGNDAFINDCGARPVEKGRGGEAGAANMVAGGRIRKEDAANRTEAAG